MIGSKRVPNELMIADIRNRSGKYFHAMRDERAHETVVEKAAQSAQM